ncbi:hypothetical protein [Adlercreutzia equolifaciens]|uniref:hypothetical protein n=1 Tax=Adlercreutzia equolifaciens TaxID=446660 RepID=UPI003521FFD0
MTVHIPRVVRRFLVVLEELVHDAVHDFVVEGLDGLVVQVESLAVDAGPVGEGLHGDLVEGRLGDKLLEGHAQGIARAHDAQVALLVRHRPSLSRRNSPVSVPSILAVLGVAGVLR